MNRIRELHLKKSIEQMVWEIGAIILPQSIIPYTDNGNFKYYLNAHEIFEAKIILSGGEEI